MLVQLLVGGVAAVGVTMRIYWTRVKRFLRISRDTPGTTSTTEDAPPSQAREATPVKVGKEG
jgi:hypothetical protein